MISDRETAYYLGKEDGMLRARSGLAHASADLSQYSDDYILGFNKGYSEMDDYASGYEEGYADSRAGRLMNSTRYKLARSFQRGYEDGFDAYTDEALRCHHEEYEAA